MRSHIMARFAGVCAHLLLDLRPRGDVCFEGLKSGSANASGCPRVDTIVVTDNLYGSLIRIRIRNFGGDWL